VLISTGKVPSREPWRILEVAVNQAPDVLALRISKELSRLHESAEALIPFTPNAAGQAEWIVEHVYIRGLNGSLSRIAQTPGIDFTRKEAAPREWIAQLLEVEKHTLLPIVGDFVRVLAGPCARLCGHVTVIKDAKFTVSVQMRTKKVIVHTSPNNLQIIECPPDTKSFYFSQ